MSFRTAQAGRLQRAFVASPLCAMNCDCEMSRSPSKPCDHPTRLGLIQRRLVWPLRKHAEIEKCTARFLQNLIWLHPCTLAEGNPGWHVAKFPSCFAGPLSFPLFLLFRPAFPPVSHTFTRFPRVSHAFPTRFPQVPSGVFQRSPPAEFHFVLALGLLATM